MCLPVETRSIIPQVSMATGIPSAAQTVQAVLSADRCIRKYGFSPAVRLPRSDPCRCGKRRPSIQLHQSVPRRRIEPKKRWKEGCERLRTVKFHEKDWPSLSGHSSHIFGPSRHGGEPQVSRQIDQRGIRLLPNHGHCRRNDAVEDRAGLLGYHPPPELRSLRSRPSETHRVGRRAAAGARRLRARLLSQVPESSTGVCRQSVQYHQLEQRGRAPGCCARLGCDAVLGAVLGDISMPPKVSSSPVPNGIAESATLRRQPADRQLS